MGQASARNNNNPHKGPLASRQGCTRKPVERCPRLVLKEVPLWGGSGGREFAHQVGRSIGRFRFREGPTSIENFDAWPIEPHQIVPARRRRQAIVDLAVAAAELNGNRPVADNAVGVFCKLLQTTHGLSSVIVQAPCTIRLRSSATHPCRPRSCLLRAVAERVPTVDHLFGRTAAAQAYFPDTRDCLCDAIPCFRLPLYRRSVAGVLSEPRRAVLDRSSAEDALGICRKAANDCLCCPPSVLAPFCRSASLGPPLYRRELEPERAAERRRRHPRQACLGAFIAWHRLVEFLHRDF